MQTRWHTESGGLHPIVSLEVHEDCVELHVLHLRTTCNAQFGSTSPGYRFLSSYRHFEVPDSVDPALMGLHEMEGVSLAHSAPTGGHQLGHCDVVITVRTLQALVKTLSPLRFHAAAVTLGTILKYCRRVGHRFVRLRSQAIIIAT